MYTNTKENEKRYQDIKAQYQDAVSRRKSAINLEETRVEVARARLKEINDRITELNNSNKISYEVGRERSSLLSQRVAAADKLREAERKLAIAKVGDDNMTEFVSSISKH